MSHRKSKRTFVKESTSKSSSASMRILGNKKIDWQICASSPASCAFTVVCRRRYKRCKENIITKKMPKEHVIGIIGKHAVVCKDIEMKGDIQIGSGTILHPQCKILAVGGPITFGQNNIIEENVTIINKLSETLTIGDENVFEVGCYVEGSKIGNKNIIEAKARILGSTSLGDNCVIGAVCSTKRDETILDNTVIYGDHHNRRTQTASANQQSSLHTRHLEYLREVLPKFNHVRVGGVNPASESQEVATNTRKAKPTASSH